MPIIQIKNLNDFKKLINTKNRIIFVKYGATWCGPCRLISPVYQAYSNKNYQCVFAEVDIGESDDIATFCDINAVPTIQVFHNGIKQDEIIGVNKKSLDNIISKYN